MAIGIERASAVGETVQRKRSLFFILYDLHLLVSNPGPGGTAKLQWIPMAIGIERASAVGEAVQ